jgi:hypothetical protein
VFVICRNAYQIVGSQNFRGKLKQLFKVLSDDAVANAVVDVPDVEQEANMEVELVASAFVEAQQNAPQTPSRAPPGTPGTKRKSAEGSGNSTSRARLHL